MTFDWRENDMKMSELTQKIAEISAKATGARHRRAGRRLQGPVRYARLPEHPRHRRHDHGRRPRISVVSQHLQHWDAQNLFVVGASVYPHNSGYNPTGLLAALALRLGDDLARYVERPRML